MASASRCAAATSSTQHDPCVVSARTKTSRVARAPSSSSSSRASAARSARASLAASGSLSSGNCRATRENAPPRIHDAVRATSYATSNVASSSRIAADGGEVCGEVARGEVAKS